ncbi:hypothetical protein RDI58_013264 [Solanum bulbocastanum]|uniref:Uncharacterized protein n=1 Tax=Solanum bulbocastanum TaxID=147425 RepID=A0AAN8TKM5_SOLBU
MPKRVREFYDAYAKVLPRMRKKTIWRIIDEIEVRSNMVQCHSNEINTVLCTSDNNDNEYKTLDTLKGWFDPIRFDESSLFWMAESSKIEKKDLNIMERY